MQATKHVKCPFYTGANNYEFLRKYFFVARKRRGCGFLHSKPLPSPLSSDEAIEIELSDWLVNQDYVICKQTRDSIVTESAPVSLDAWKWSVTFYEVGLYEILTANNNLSPKRDWEGEIYLKNEENRRVSSS